MAGEVPTRPPCGGPPTRPVDAALAHLLSAVDDRTARCADGDRSAVLSPDALEDVGALLAAIPATALDATVARAAGLLLWWRSRSLDADHDHHDLAAALALLGPLWRADPGQVPAEVAEFFDDVGPDVVKPTDAWHGPALALAEQVERTGDAAAASIVVELLRRVAAGTPPEDDERGPCLANLATALQVRYELAGSAADLDDAIAAGRAAAHAFPAADPRRLVPLAGLAVALRRRFGATGDGEDLDEAIALGRRVVQQRPAGDPTLPERLSNLGVALQHRFEWAGDPADATAAITAHRRALAATAAGDRRRAAALVNLAAVMYSRFEATGAVADLDEAIRAARDAGAGRGLDDPARAAVRSSLCNGLRARFRYTSSSADLDDAVQAGEEAVGLLPAGHPDRAAALTNLGLALHARSRRQRSAGDLDRSIAALREATAATPSRHPDLPGRLSNLCDALLTRVDLAGGAAARADRRAELDDAVATGRQAVAAAAHHPRRHLYLSNLGNALLSRFETSGDIADLDEAITCGRLAAEACPPDGPDAATCLANVAVAVHARAEQLYIAGDVTDAIALARQAATAPAGSPTIRVRAAARWGHWAAARGDWPDAAAGMTQAVGLLGRISPRDLPSADQEFELARLGGLGCDAAACALHADDAAAAVALLEQGRGIVLSHAFDGASSAHPPAHAIDGASLAHPGPVAMINVSRLRSDAILLTRNGILVRTLPTLTPDAIRGIVERFLVAVETLNHPDAATEESDAAETALEEILGWLWDNLAGPVLDQLGITRPPQPEQPWPRLWWCPTGLLSLLPIHAAGHHRTTAAERGPAVLDRVISSVTPTLRALAHARRPPHAGDSAPRSPGRILVVASPDVPGQIGLPAADAERQHLLSLFPGAVTPLTGRHATRAATLAAMPGHPRVHLACHAQADVVHPSRSRLLLADHAQSPLTAADLSRLRLPDAELAFLSACETARTGAELADEAVHLASALHVAGYRHVLATLWPVADRPALGMSRAVYADLATHHDIARLPAAVHAATQRLRDRYRRHPSAWAAHVHIGP